MHSGRFLPYSRKRKINQNDHSLSFIVTRYHSLPLVVPLVSTGFTTRCHRLYHSLSVVIIGCITRLSFYKRLIYSTIVSKYDGSKLHANPFIEEYSECSNFRNKNMRTAVLIVVATKIDSKKVIYDGAFLRKKLTAKSH